MPTLTPTTAGVLHVVATPIGNRDDISARALATLRTVDLIAAEDTRHSRPLLDYYGINTPLVSLHEHNERARVPQLIAELDAGRSIALISDAGTPLVSDPGFHLVRGARAAGIRVVPVPGACSVVAALAAAGLPSDRFVFEGFLPAKPAARRSRLSALLAESRTLVFFESSHRIADTLAEMAATFGPERPAAIARELTKLYEEIQSDTLQNLNLWLAADANHSRGEFVVLVQGAPETATDTTEAQRILAALLTELPPARAAAVAARLTGWKKNALYTLALTLGTTED